MSNAECSRIVGSMTSTNPPTSRRTVILFLLVTAFVVVLTYVIHLSTVQRDHFTKRGGKLVEIEQSPVELRDDGSVLADTLLLSSGGLRIRLRTLLPPEVANGRIPVVLLIGGHRTGRYAVDLVDDPRGIAYVAIDYPYEGEHSLSGALQILGAVPDIQEAFLDTPPALMLAMDWLSGQPWFDANRAEIAGVSLGVPFAAVAGGLDTRFSRVWLIHGAVENHEWVMHASRDRIRNRVLRSLAVRGTLLLAYGNSFQTADWLREIAPRPVILIAARNDDRVPASSIDAIVEVSKSDHIRLVWTEGLHIDPDRDFELQQLIRIVADEINIRGYNGRPAVIQ